MTFEFTFLYIYFVITNVNKTCYFNIHIYTYMYSSFYFALLYFVCVYESINILIKIKKKIIFYICYLLYYFYNPKLHVF